ncbi:RebB family R body protein [Shewanella waksmanii]|uniref:RebB family R body protein n=1 Tax=Shewanella waksmanii TaxID=213783 RepID=UPI00373624C5
MSTVNDQVTDAVTQLNALLTGGAAPQSLSMVDIAGAETMGMSMFNAITAQQNSQTSASAAATASCAKMLKTEVPALPDKDKKDQLALALLEIELAEHKVAISLAVNTLYQLYKQSHPTVKAADAQKAFTSALSKAEKAIGSTVSDKSQINTAAAELTAGFNKLAAPDDSNNSSQTPSQ